MPATQRVAPLLSDQVFRTKSIVDDDDYRRSRRQPLVPRFVRGKEGHINYDPAAAHICAMASAWSYASVDTLRATLKDVMEVELDCSEFSASNPTMYLDTDVFFLKTNEPRICPRTGILVFRGTELTSLGDFLADMYVEMRPFPHRGNQQGKVHAGFFHGAMAVWKRVYNMLVQNPVDHLLITGHSLGAALAVLTAAQIFREHELREDPRFDGVVKSLAGLYTFGQPAVGDAAFARWAEERLGAMTFRHVFAHDVVPFLPTSDVNENYQHYESGVWTCKRDELTWTGPNMGRDFDVARSFGAAMALSFVDFATRRIPMRVKPLRRLLEATVPYSLDDHSPLNYIRVSEASLRTAPQTSVSAPAFREEAPSAQPRPSAE